MERIKYLLKNIGLLTISSFGSKFLSFLLVPLYTNVLTAQEYGTFDLYYTTISLLIPILTINIIESVLRFSLDKNNNPKEIFSIGLSIIIKGTLIFSIIIILNSIFNIVPYINEYLIYFILWFIVQIMYDFLVFFARGREEILGVSICGVINTCVMLVLNILFLVYFKKGIYGYFSAHIIALFIGSLYLIIKLRVWNFIKFNNLSLILSSEMKQYSIPLILNSIAWWINSASDRYIVVGLCGIAASGIYSIGYKIPSILTVCQSIFNKAWQLSAVKSINSSDKNNFFLEVYSLYNFIIVFISSILIILSRFLAKLLYAKEFYEAWVYVPFLLIAVVFGAMSGYIEGIFIAVKDTKTCSKSTVIGAIFNIVFNIILVLIIGPIGAAISTAISYFIVWLIRITHLKKHISLSLNLKKDVLVYIILVIQALLVLSEICYLSFIILQISMILAIIVLNLKEIKGTIFRVIGKRAYK